MTGQTFRESRTLTVAQVDQMDAAAARLDFETWSRPVIKAMNDAMAAVRDQMIAAGTRPNPGAYSFTIVFEAQGAES